MFTPARVDQPELLDEHDAPHADMERSLCDLRRFNRYAGGLAIYRRLLRRFGNVRSILDVGAGSADNIASVSAAMRIALDCKVEHLLFSGNVLRVVADAARLPFRSGSVDVVTSAHFFHHFTPDENVALLDEALRVARQGVVVNDTRRHYVPLLFVKWISALRLVGRITRFDAPASVLRGYTTGEALDIGRRTRASRVETRNFWPYRFGLTLWK